MLEHVIIIVPVYNGEKWIDECFQSVISQTILSRNKNLQLTLSVFNDASSDESLTLLTKWRSKIESCGVQYIIESNTGPPKGVGYARNHAVDAFTRLKKSEIARGNQYYCFLDCDDVMMTERIEKQLELCRDAKDAIIGCQFSRNDNATARFTDWCNDLPSELLETQIYTSHGPTVAMPTWFLHQSRLLKFSEEGQGTPEDLIYFYEHLNNGGKVKRVDQTLMMYRYHPGNTTFSITSDEIWTVKLEAFVERILSKMENFGIWGAGKLGKQFFRSLPEEIRHKVSAFYDVDESKIKHGHVNLPYLPDEKSRWVPVKHVSTIEAPFVICLKLNLIGFEEILKGFEFVEGKDFWIFN